MSGYQLHGRPRTAVNAARQVIAQPEYRRVARGAFLSPWFAVSLGILIAASLALAEPRAALSFPPSSGSHCGQAACTSVRHDQAGNAAPALPGGADAGL